MATPVIPRSAATRNLLFSRRDFLKSGGALVVSFAMPSAALAQSEEAAGGATLGPALRALDSWIAIGADGSVVASVGKVEVGMGISTAFAQIVAEELDVPLDRVALRMGDTETTPDQRGTGGSNGIMQGGKALRDAGAEARAALVSLASKKLGVATTDLVVEDGVVYVASDRARHASYGELIGDKRFAVDVTGKAKPKDPKTYRVVGQPIARRDIPPKVTASYIYLVDHRVPGMLHGRVIRPPAAHAKLVRVGDASSLPGVVKVVTREDFVGVVCEREDQALRAARDLAIEWSTPEPTFPRDYDALYAHLASAPAKVSHVEQSHGDIGAAFARAARVVEARYEWPFQSHASMGPACAIADVRADAATIWFGGQKPYPLRLALAELLRLPAERVRVIWMPGPGSYGMNDADDAAADAALLAQAVGKPVRLQYMRVDGTGWDPKAPAGVFNVRGALDDKDDVIALDYAARGLSTRLRPSGTEVEGDTLAAQLYGKSPKGVDIFPLSGDSYRFAAKRKASDVIAWDAATGTALRTAHLRDPNGPASCFALETFIDELAAAVHMDPVEFRLKYLSDARDRAAVEAAAKAAKWQSRASPNPRGDAAVLKGRGIAYAPRNGAIVAIVAEVEVERATGRYRCTRFTVAHDCGLVVNPSTLKGTIEANVIQTMSRAMHEQVLFDPTRVLSVDWASYPIVDMTEVPDAIDIVIVNNRPDAPSRGAGEPSSRPMVAAIGNALFDATGVRLRRVPFTFESVKAALDRKTRPA